MMTERHFANETFLLPDYPKGRSTQFHAGDVIRVFDGAFSDAVILGFDAEGNARVSRPYAYANSTGTTCCNSLLGQETFELTPNNLRIMLETLGRKEDPRGVQSDKRTTR